MPAACSSKKVVTPPGNSGVIRKTVQPKEATLCPELVDFNIMNFGEHWRQCIAAAPAVLSRSASPGELASERTSTEASQESHPDSVL